MHGQLEQIDGLWKVVFTRQLAHEPRKVWRALTEPEHLTAWFPTDIEGERTPGSKLRFVFRGGEGEPFDGEMLVFDPPSVLELTWGDEHLRFELQPDERGTLLRLVVTFDEIGKAARDSAGWHVCLDRLRADLDGTSLPSGDDGWKKLFEEYKQQFGPEASTIGPPTMAHDVDSL